MLDVPSQAPYARHLFICSGRYCDPSGEAVKLYNLLARKLGELGNYENPKRVKRGLTPVSAFATTGRCWSSIPRASGIIMWTKPYLTASSKSIWSRADRLRSSSSIV